MKPVKSKRGYDMCGFVGIYKERGTEIKTDIINKMTDVQAHRGPDDRGLRYFSINKGISKEAIVNENGLEGAVGFNRLSIVDLSSRGHQPMTINKSRIILVFNGEIYNALTYRKKLIRQGVNFSSETDTEVIIRLYEKYGFAKLLEKLNGMFAISIIDLQKGVIYIARDRLGIKPLYYYYKDGLLLFSSEVKSFLFHPRFHGELNYKNLDEFLIFRHIADAETLLKDVYRVCPGGYLLYNKKSLKKRKYWSVENNKQLPPDSPEISERIIKKLNKAISMRLMSDVNIGVSLSGGIDSSLVAAEAARQEQLDSFSIIFNNQEYSEEKWIDKVAEKVNINPHKYNVNPHYFTDNFAKATWHLDNPLTNASSLAYLYLCEKASSKIKVLLTGEGSDEVFAGYRRYPISMFLDKYSAIEQILIRLPLLKDKFLHRYNRFNNKYVDKYTRFILVTSFMSCNFLEKIKPDSIKRIDRIIEKRKTFFLDSEHSFIEQCLNYDLKTYLPPILNHQDKIAMANSVESRTPFLDHELIEMVKGLPIDYLVKSAIKGRTFLNSKIILKKYAASLFGNKFAYRTKIGFFVPFKEFIFSSHFKDYIEDLILPSIKKRGIFNYPYLLKSWRQLSAGEDQLITNLWRVFAFECWAQLFLDNNYDSQFKGVNINEYST